MPKDSGDKPDKPKPDLEKQPKRPKPKAANPKKKAKAKPAYVADGEGGGPAKKTKR